MATKPAMVLAASKPARLGHQRARTLEDKDLRRSHLLQAAAALFAQNDFDGVTIAQMAQRAGVAKGTAYLYFNCKEAVFLELVRAELTQWELALSTALRALPEVPTEDAVPKTIARTLAERPTLARLLVLLHSIIEPRLDFESAYAFKLFLRDLITRLGADLVLHIPGLSQEQATLLVLQVHALVISVTQLASPPPTIAQVLQQDASLQLMCVGFESFLSQTLCTLLHGTLHANRPAT